MNYSNLNIKPVGSGSFKIKEIKRDSSEIITSAILVPNKKFVLGNPYIKKLIIKFYPSEKKLLEAYENKEIDSISAIAPQILEEIKRNDRNLKNFFLPRVFGIFFNQNNAKIFSYQEVRQALNIATDKNKIVEKVINGFGKHLDYPIPTGTFGALEKKTNDFSLENSQKILEKNGWQKKNGIFEKKISKKETLRLEFSLSTSNMPELKQTAELIKSMWEQIGANVDLKIFETGDLNQNIIRPRKYDALLFGQIVGREPDLFIFWHSSQRNDPGLNIALYANIKADKLLEEARATVNKDKRKEIYKQFQEEIEKDAPAVFLYSPYFIYLLPKSLMSLDEFEVIAAPAERFSQIHKWYLKTKKVWKIFAR
jgi:peptide/nickel transport system substrate-binding protein